MGELFFLVIYGHLKNGYSGVDCIEARDISSLQIIVIKAREIGQFHIKFAKLCCGSFLHN